MSKHLNKVAHVCGALILGCEEKSAVGAFRVGLYVAENLSGGVPCDADIVTGHVRQV